MQMMLRYFLIIITLMVMPLKVLAEAIKDQVVMSYSYYSDNVDVEVLSPFIGLQKRLSAHWGMNASFQIDAISAASMRRGSGDVIDGVIIDAVSGASGRWGYDDVRVAPTLSFTYENEDYSWNIGSYYSNEIDYETYAGFTEVSSGFNDANTILSLGVSYEKAKWDPVINRELSEDTKTQRQINASVTQLIDAESYVQVRASYIYLDGLLSSPYHYSVGAGKFDKYPDKRNAYAIAAQYVTLLGEKTSMNLNYRYYKDDWEIKSHTLEAQFYYDLQENLTLGARGRYYKQDAAEFVKPVGGYVTSDRYIVSDYKYTEFDSYTIGVSLHYVPDLFGNEGLGIQLSYDKYATDDNDYIKAWYGKSKIEADMLSFALTYDF